jgi:PAS domain S-box-containing protein
MNSNPSESTTEEFNPLEYLRSVYDSVEASIFVVDVLEGGEFRYLGLNPTYERWMGMRSEDLRGKTPEEVLSVEEAQRVRQRYTDCVRSGKAISYEECLPLQGVLTWWITTLTPLLDANSRIYRLIGTSTNITQRKQVEEALQQQAQREQLLGSMRERIRQSLDLDTILHRTVTGVRQFLDCDRVLIYRFEPDWSGKIVVESVVRDVGSVLGQNIKDHCFSQYYIELYKRGRVQVVEDIYAARLSPCHRELLASFDVRANLVVPIIGEQDLWGLLIAQNCQETREWLGSEVDLLKQLATQVGIAAQQAELHQQVQRLNAHLESQVQQRTIELQQSYNFEALVRRITEKIRDTLDETHVLQTAAAELVQVLKVECCKIELYSPCHTSATIVYEYAANQPLCKGITRQIANFPEIYQHLLQKQPLQFGEIIPTWNPTSALVTRLACPIFDDQGIIGNLWLIKPKQEAFDELEIRLVQNVANQCAIAIRQARLYEASQAQVRELEKLKHLKNDFLRTISHELRTPITSISLASETLEAIFQRKKTGDADMAQVLHLLHIMHRECRRESQLINDLLTLSYLEAETEPLHLVEIDLHKFLPSIIESFRERTNSQQQQLNLIINSEVPVLQTDIHSLERILMELLNNACKYTPAGETITVSARATNNSVRLEVSNSGVEISPDERSRIFSPFYRIPKNDPWKYGGTGLGLALVRKLAKNLGAAIDVESSASSTTFTLSFPR